MRSLVLLIPCLLCAQVRTADPIKRGFKLTDFTSFLGGAHTGGDLSVYLPQKTILFLSETFLNRVFPAMLIGISLRVNAHARSGRTKAVKSRFKSDW